ITIDRTQPSLAVSLPSVEARVAARREKARRDADRFGWPALLSAAARVVGEKVVARLGDRAREGHSYRVKQEALRAAIGAERASRRGDVDADRHAGAAAAIAQAAHERRLELYLLLAGRDASEEARERWQSVPDATRRRRRGRGR
ncbi:MAG: hypothetical protein ACREX8_06530, partial [Gammaproteobacteria bacterium]